MKKILLYIPILLLAGAAGAEAQDRVEASLGTDIVSRYIWRGQDLGAVSLQPSLGVAFKGLSLGAWGSAGLSNPSDTEEFDLTLGYSIGGFNIGVTDYWFNAGPDLQNRYFKYCKGVTNHVFEATAGYDFGFVSLQWYTNFAGNDSLNGNGRLSYSSYLEASVPFAFGGVDWTATAGVVPFATDFYGADGFAFINVALTAAKDIRVTDTFSIPVFAQLAANPYDGKAFLVFGITLQP